MKKVRVLKMVVQPYLVVDDGEDLDPVPCEPITIPSKDWSQFSGKVWPQWVQDFEDTLNTE